MKKLLVMISLAISIFILPVVSYSQEIPMNPWGISWDANSERDLAGYRIYITITPGQGYEILEDVPLANLSNIAQPKYRFRLNEFLDGKYWSVITAYDNAGNESGYSNEVFFEVDQIPPEIPGGCKIIANTVNIINNYYK